MDRVVLTIALVAPLLSSGCWSKLMGETDGTRSAGALGEPCDDPPSSGGANPVMCSAGLTCKNKICAVGGVGSTPVTLASGVGHATDIAVDANNVYWVSPAPGGNGFVWQLPKAGGTSPVQVANGQGAPTCIAVDKTSVYWRTDNKDGMGFQIMKAPIGGGTPVTLAENQRWANGGITTGCIKVDANNVYWTNTNDGTSGAPEVLKCAVGGCGMSPTTIAATGEAGRGLAIDDHAVYWIEAEGAVKNVPLDGGPVTLFASAGQGGNVIAVDATSLYWLTDTPHQVETCRKTSCGATPQELASVSGAGATSGVAVDDAYVFWPSGDVGIMKVPKAGGATTVVVAGDVGLVQAIALDADNVYFTTVSGSVMVVSK